MKNTCNPHAIPHSSPPALSNFPLTFLSSPSGWFLGCCCCCCYHAYIYTIIQVYRSRCEAGAGPVLLPSLFRPPLLRRPSPHLFPSLFPLHVLSFFFPSSLHPYLWYCFLDPSSGYVAASCESMVQPFPLSFLGCDWYFEPTIFPPAYSSCVLHWTPVQGRSFPHSCLLLSTIQLSLSLPLHSPFRFSSFSPSPQFFLFLLERVPPALFTHGLHTSCVLCDYWFHLQPWFIRIEYTFFVWFIIRFLSFFFLLFLPPPSRTIRYIYENSMRKKLLRKKEGKTNARNGFITLRIWGADFWNWERDVYMIITQFQMNSNFVHLPIFLLTLCSHLSLSLSLVFFGSDFEIHLSVIIFLSINERRTSYYSSSEAE